MIVLSFSNSKMYHALHSTILHTIIDKTVNLEYVLRKKYWQKMKFHSLEFWQRMRIKNEELMTNRVRSLQERSCRTTGSITYYFVNLIPAGPAPWFSSSTFPMVLHVLCIHSTEWVLPESELTVGKDTLFFRQAAGSMSGQIHEVCQWSFCNNLHKEEKTTTSLNLPGLCCLSLCK